MSRPTFTEWLFQQQGRNDDVGALARTAADDDAWPGDADDLIGYFIVRVTDGGIYGTESEDAVYAAMDEYDKAHPRRVVRLPK